MDALALANLLVTVVLLIIVVALVRRLLRERGRVGLAEPQNIQSGELETKLERVIDLLAAKPGAQGRLGEASLELALGGLPGHCWQKQPTLPNGRRPDYLLRVNTRLRVALDAKLLGSGAALSELSEAEGGGGGGADPLVIVEQAAREVASRYLDPANDIALCLLVVPAGLYSRLTAELLGRCHGRGVIVTGPEGVAALALLLGHLAPWLPGNEETQALAATRRGVVATLELLERGGRQGRNSQENLERSRQLLEGVRNRLEAGGRLKSYGGYTPPLEEARR